MKYELIFNQDEIQLKLSESLRLAEGQSVQLELPRDPSDAAPLRQIEDQVRLFLKRFVADTLVDR